MKTAWRSLSLAAALAAGLAAGSARGAGDGPLWPLDLGHRYLTSNFMEYRDGRFHAGLDLKTNSRTGYPVRAAADGDVVRIKTASGGYGKAIYLRTAGGRTYVYAHLERLADDLRTRLRQGQRRHGRYGVDLFFAPGELPVRRGQVLALSGQTGTRGPHLHFEVRDAAGRPVDPQAHGFAAPDTLPPVISAVRAVPAAAGARVAGQPAAAVVTGGREGLPGELPPLTVTGPVAFSVRVHDRSDAMGHRLAPQTLRLWVDGHEVFAARNDTLDWERNGQLRLEFLETDGVRERWLHRDPADHVRGRRGGPWFRGTRGAGLAPGTHALRLVAGDRAGNETAVAWTLVIVAPGEAVVLPAAGSEPAWRTTPLGPVLPAAAPGAEPVRLPPLVEPARPPAAVPLHLEPGRDPGVLAPVTLWRRQIAAPAPAAARPRELAPLGAPVLYAAARWPVSQPVTVAWPDSLGRLTDRDVAVYRQRDDGRWDRVGPLVRDAEGHLLFDLEKPGLHAAMLDTTPPVIVAGPGPRPVGPGPSAVVPEVTPPRWEILCIPVGDHGAGVDWDGLQAWLDGAPLIVEPDAPRDRVLVELPDDVAPGTHRLGLEVADRAGRATTTVLTVTVGAAGPSE